MGAFNGQLRTNEIFSALYNMIISQEVFADNIGEHQTLVDKARVDGGLFGDTKLYYATDVLKSAPWGNDAEATNLLALHRPPAPACQAISLDIFRQICLTVDNYLTKRAWSDEAAFSLFNSVMLGWMKETKRVYDGTLYNVFIGTTKSAKAAQNIELDLAAARSSASTQEEANRLEVECLAQGIADLLIAMGDYSRDFNDYEMLRSYAKDGIKFVWNSKYVNKVRKIDLPTIFHKEGLVDKFEEEILPARYFGRAITAGDIGAGKVIGADGAYDPTKGTLRVNKELEYNDKHYFPGDALAETGTYVAVVGGLEASDVYLEDDKVIAKVLVKLPPYMSAFEVGTSFFNPKSLTETHYLTFGHNTLEYLKNYPFITIIEKSA